MRKRVSWIWWAWVLACCAGELVNSQDNSYLVNCGGQQGNATFEGRQWEGDNSSSLLTVSSSSQTVSGSYTGNPIPASSPVFSLLNTSRIFISTSGYTFPVSPGRYWVRLYFFPFVYESFDPAASVFSVTAGTFTLLSSVNISEIIPSNSSFLFKELSVNVTDTPLIISFIPVSSFAFVNALEVSPIPSKLFTDSAMALGINSPSAVGIPEAALETMFRVNVGGPLISPSFDSSSLYRTWLANESYLASNAAEAETVSGSPSSLTYKDDADHAFAPPMVYSTALQMSTNDTSNGQAVNLTWEFTVFSGYQYLIRLHLCELVYGTGGKRVFAIYLQNETAYASLDLGQKLGQNVVYHTDVVVNVGEEQSLWLQVGPPPGSDSAIFNAGILNGVEIWKMSNNVGSLDGQSATGLSSPASSKRRLALIVGAIVGALAALGLIVTGFCFFSRQRAKIVKQPSTAWVPLPMHGGFSLSLASKTTIMSGTGSYVSSVPSNMGRIFGFADILEATRNFDEALVLGVGGFGKVYQGELDDGTVVAVKRGNPRSEQGIMEFQTEIEMLSKLRHRHLVSLIGYCKENQEMVLVYEYMAKGPLRSHLYGSDYPTLSWKKRLEICIGAARGLHYLHTGATQCIIHRDVKTTNILLDENLVAKVSDFGLSKTGPAIDRTHVTTAVKGSFGYLDPEYFRRQQLTEKSDVYSFGVVLFEVLCARPAINPALPRDEVNIAEWALQKQNLGKLEEIVDPKVAGTINKDSLEKFGETARKCLADEGVHRPTIGEVLWNLEYALQLQETANCDMAQSVEEEISDRICELPMLHSHHPMLQSHQEPGDESMVTNHSFTECEDEDATISAVFSQMVRRQTP